MNENFVILIAIVAVIAVIAVILPKSLPKSDEENADVRNTMESKFNALGDRIKTMTLSEISRKINSTERSVRIRLMRSKLACLDFDPIAYEKKVADAGGHESFGRKLEADYKNLERHGPIVPVLTCPHCQTKGSVRRLKGPNEAVLTTSNTYKAKSLTKMHCDTCETDWSV